MLNELDKEFLRRIADEDEIRNALWKYFEDDFLNYLPLINDESDEVLGQKYRAFFTAKNLVSKALDNLSVYKGRKINKNNETLERCTKY